MSTIQAAQLRLEAATAKYWETVADYRAGKLSRSHVHSAGIVCHAAQTELERLIRERSA